MSQPAQEVVSTAESPSAFRERGRARCHPGHLADPINSHIPRGTLLGPWPPRFLPGLRAWAARLTLCAPARLGDRLSEQTTGEVTAAYTVGTPCRCTRTPSGPQTQSGARPQVEALSSTLSASGSRSAWAAAPHLQVLQEASWASGPPAGRSQCAPVNPAGPSRSLRVPALGSEQPGQQHPVYKQCRR